MKNKITRLICMVSKLAFYGTMLQVFFLSFLLADKSTAQQFKSVYDVKISIDLVNVSVEDVFREIESKTNFNFLFNRNILDQELRMTLKRRNSSVADVLMEVSRISNLKFKQINFTINVNTKAEDEKENGLEVIVQTRNITGRVISQEDGQGIPGVNVIEKGTSNGTVTDVQGYYALDVSEGAVLVFSSVGYTSEELAVGNRSVVDLAMTVDVHQLDELVVVGYGTQRRADVTGSIASVSEEALQSRPVVSFADALKGRSSGVQIRQSGGDLDGRFSIAIRGVGSVTGSNDPLIVVDGVPLFSANFSTINPKDIASIDILKDASATAIFGSRAANGVIMITTKKGQTGRTQLTFDTDFGFENITRKYDMLSTEQQRQLFVEAFKNSNRSTEIYDDPTNPIWQIDTDWQDLATRTAIRQNYNLGFSGGSERTTFSGSASYLNREGTLLNTDFQLYSVRLNMDSDINNWLNISTNFTGSHQTQNFVINDTWNARGGFRDLAFQHSYTEAYDDRGNLTAINTTAAPYFGANENPLIEILLPTRQSSASRILGNTKLDVSLVKGLTLSANVGGDILIGNRYLFNPVYSIGRYNRPEGNVTEGTDQQLNWVGDLTLNYERRMDQHDLRLLTGASVQQFTSKFNNVIGSGTINNSLNQLSNQNNFSATGTDVTAGLLSTFMRVNYGFASKYLATATIRRDGSSKFGPENRYGVFPSGSVAWRASQENFFQTVDVIDDLKFRVSYGLTGNQNIGNFAYITRAGNAPYVFGNNVQVGNAPLNLGNPRLKWEATVQFNAGMDLSLVQGRVYTSVDFYNKRSQDLLISQPVPLTAGVTQNPIVNIGSVRNRGVELSLNTVNFSGPFSWFTDFNISFNNNKVLDIGTNSLGEPLEIPGENIPLSNIPINLTRAGHPVGAFYMYDFIGIWQLGEEEAALNWSNAVPGDARYADLNGNGRLDVDDRYYVGNPHPRYFGGIDNTFSFNRFSLSVLAEFAGGYQLYNSARNLLARAVPFAQNLAEVADFWTPDNPTNKVPRPSQGGNTTTLATLASTRYLEDADFFRIKNIRLAYDISSPIFGNAIQSARVILSGTNLITFTKYSGLDPEVSSRSSLLSAGIDHTAYPQVRLLSMGIQVNF